MVGRAGRDGRAERLRALLRAPRRAGAATVRRARRPRRRRAARPLPRAAGAGRGRRRRRVPRRARRRGARPARARRDARPGRPRATRLRPGPCDERRAAPAARGRGRADGPPAGTGARAGARARGPHRRVRESRRCRQVEIAEHFGEAAQPCGSATAAPARRHRAARPPEDAAPELPTDIAAAIVAAVRSLGRPLGTSGLVATLSGSVAAPPTGRRHRSYGLLAAAPPSRIKSWIGTLVGSGHLERFTSDDGYPLLRAGTVDEPLPRLGSPAAAANAAPDGDPLFERLRAWRLTRAREESVPAFVVFSDRTLREVAATKPADEHELAAVNGVGPAKIERYGSDVLEVVAAFT